MIKAVMKSLIAGAIAGAAAVALLIVVLAAVTLVWGYAVDKIGLFLMGLPFGLSNNMAILWAVAVTSIIGVGIIIGTIAAIEEAKKFEVKRKRR